MAKKLTAKQMDARYEALCEASRHLQADWTSSAVEHAEGLVMAAWLQEQAEAWFVRAETARLRGTASK